jgi:hypothetical protein
MRETGSRVHIDPVPPGPNVACGDCDVRMRQAFGCPFVSGRPWFDGDGDGWQGKSKSVYRPSTGSASSMGKEPPAWMRTCPQHYANSPFVVSIQEDVCDYEAGRLGDSRDLYYPYWQYLKFASAERKDWLAWWEAELRARATSKSKGAKNG